MTTHQMNAPCRARTPILILFASFGHQQIDSLLVNPDHRLAKILGKLRQKLCVLEVRYSLDKPGKPEYCKTY